MFPNAHYQVAFLTTEANAGWSSIQFDDSKEFVGLVPDSHGAVRTAWRKQPHLGAAGQSCDVIHVIVITVVIKPLWIGKQFATLVDMSTPYM